MTSARTHQSKDADSVFRDASALDARNAPIAVPWCQEHSPYALLDPMKILGPTSTLRPHQAHTAPPRA